MIVKCPVTLLDWCLVHIAIQSGDKECKKFHQIGLARWDFVCVQLAKNWLCDVKLAISVLESYKEQFVFLQEPLDKLVHPETTDCREHQASPDPTANQGRRENGVSLGSRVRWAPEALTVTPAGKAHRARKETAERGDPRAHRDSQDPRDNLDQLELQARGDHQVISLRVVVILTKSIV